MTFFNDYYLASALILNFNPTQGRLLIAPARRSANKFALCSRLLAILNFNPTQGRLLIAPARHSTNKFALCSRLLAILNFEF